jgi:hypothetical protein
MDLYSLYSGSVSLYLFGFEFALLLIQMNRSRSRETSPCKVEDFKTKKLYISNLPEGVSLLLFRLPMMKSLISFLSSEVLQMSLSRTKKPSHLPLLSSLASTRLRKHSKRKIFTFGFFILFDSNLA